MATPTGEEVEFAFPASFDEKGNLTTETQAIFPAQNITDRALQGRQSYFF